MPWRTPLETENGSDSDLSQHTCIFCNSATGSFLSRLRVQCSYDVADLRLRAGVCPQPTDPPPPPLSPAYGPAFTHGDHGVFLATMMVLRTLLRRQEAGLKSRLMGCSSTLSTVGTPLGGCNIKRLGDRCILLLPPLGLRSDCEKVRRQRPPLPLC